ncbi:MAG: DUF2807 domain-containing protein, partial [Flavobacteriales bacterium]|nr:DUF2807 domain-containing protein [Flavobacteriales bacterium]
MSTEEPNTPSLELLRDLPTEVSLGQVEQWVALFPPVPPPTPWYHHFSLNSILMTTASTLLIGGALYLLSADPATTPHTVQLPAPPAGTTVPQTPVSTTAAPLLPHGPAAPQQLPTNAPVLTVDTVSASEPPAAPAPIAPPSAPPPVTAAPPPATVVPASVASNERRFDLSGFQSIRLHGSLNIHLEQGPFSVVAMGSERDLNDVRAEVGNKTLVVSQANSQRFYTGRQEPLKVVVRMPDLNGLEVFGSGSISAGRFTSTGKVALKVQGSGDVSVEALANARELTVELYGSGDVVCKDAEVSGTTTLTLTGSGDVEIGGRTEQLIATLTGSGDVEAGDLRAQRAKVNLTGSGDATVNSASAVEQIVSG